jgi:proteasome maturation protein
MEEASKTIAHQIGGVQTDSLRFGLPGVKSDIIGAHPLESSLQSVIISLFHSFLFNFIF